MNKQLCDGSSRLLEIDNGHGADSGQPPTLDTADYLGYFENNHVEQWVFVGDRAKGTAALWGGDAGWAKCHQITADQMAPDVVLNREEAWWLVTCWAAMLHRRVDEVASDFDMQARERARQRQPRSTDKRP